MEQPVPSYIFNYGIAGIFLLVLSFIFWAIFYFSYDVELYSSVEAPTEKPEGWKATGILTLVSAVLGIILSSFTLYGHYLLDKQDINIVRKVNISTEQNFIPQNYQVAKYQKI